MSERYYVVSESELERWADINEILGACKTSEQVGAMKDEHIAAEAACRARPVPEWATHFAQIERGTDELERWEEIQR